MIQLSGVRKTLGTRELFGGLDLSIAAGERVALLGPSGSGKTTLLRILGGLILCDGGEARVDGQPLGALGPSARAAWRAERVGFVFQGVNLLPHLSVRDNLTLPGAFRRAQGRSLDAGQVEEALSAVGLSGFESRRAGTLSGGEAQRVAVARAVVQRPALLLCDEPTGNLDAASAARVAALLLDTSRVLGCLLVVATHDEALARGCGRGLRLGAS